MDLRYNTTYIRTQIYHTDLVVDDPNLCENIKRRMLLHCDNIDALQEEINSLQSAIKAERNELKELARKWVS